MRSFRLMFVAALIALLSISAFAEKPAVTGADESEKKQKEGLPPVLIELPEGWTEKTPTVKTASQFAEFTELVAFFELVTEPAGDFADDLGLAGWSKIVKANSAKVSKLKNRTETDLHEGKIGDLATEEYEVTGDMNALKLRFRIIMVKVNDHFCKVVCWTTPSHWKDAQPKFEELLKHFK